MPPTTATPTTESAPSTAVAPPEPRHRTSLPGNLLRGALIGVVETVPGVSGGTVALVAGIYHELISSVSALVSALRAVASPSQRGTVRERLAQVRWRVLLPVAVGMAAAVLTIADPMANAVEQHPVHTRGLFLGMVLASLAVPLRMVRQVLLSTSLGTRHHRERPVWLLAVGVLAAAATYALVSLEPTSVEPSPPAVVVAAAVAVSALVLPGLSGSFLLLTLGLYEPTLRAVADRDLGYLAPFGLGALLGLALVVKTLQRLLTHHEAMTLAALTGLMLGGARALWPWQEGGELLAPGDGATGVLALGVLGLGTVASLIAVERLLSRPGALTEVRSSTEA